MKRILVIHGPNLGLLGLREPDIYGNFSLEDINKKIKKLAKEKKVSVDFLQSNHEGKIVDAIGSSPKKYDAIVINPAAYTHTSVAIRDAISSIDIPVIEVHLSNIYRREEFRHKSLVAAAATGQISGFGVNSYLLGVLAVIELIKDSQK